METGQGFKLEKCLVTGAALLTAVIAPSAFASGGGAGHSASFADLIPYWINFSIYVVLMTVLLRKPVARAWAARTETIRNEVDRGRIERESAEHALEEAKARKSRLQVDITNLRIAIEREASAEAQEILTEALRRAERVRQQGSEMLEAEQKAFEGQLKKMLAEDVIRRATKTLKQSMNSQKDASLRAAALNDVTRLVH